jgi:hypothetical protein
VFSKVFAEVVFRPVDQELLLEEVLVEEQFEHRAQDLVLVLVDLVEQEVLDVDHQVALHLVFVETQFLEETLDEEGVLLDQVAVQIFENGAEKNEGGHRLGGDVQVVRFQVVKKLLELFFVGLVEGLDVRVEAQINSA